MSGLDGDQENSQEYKRSSFCGFNRELFNNLKKRSVLCSSSSSQSSSQGSLWENSGEDELLLESIKQVEDKMASESMSLESKNKIDKTDNNNIEIITIDASDSEDDEKDTLLLAQDILPKDVASTHKSSYVMKNTHSVENRKTIVEASDNEDDEEDTILLPKESLTKDVVKTHQSSFNVMKTNLSSSSKKTNQYSDAVKNSESLEKIQNSQPTNVIKKNNQPSHVGNNNLIINQFDHGKFGNNISLDDAKENNQPSHSSTNIDVPSVSHPFENDSSESYRKEIMEINKEIDILVAQFKARKKTGLITFSYERLPKGRVRVMGQKTVSGQLFRTSKHLGLSQEEGELKAVTDMLHLLQAKYFPERKCADESLEKYEHDLVQFCKESNLNDPEFKPHLMEGKYHITLAVGSQVSNSGPTNFIKDARAIAARNWLQRYGGNWRQVLDNKDIEDQESGCMVFQCSGGGGSRQTIQGEGDQIEEKATQTIDLDLDRVRNSPGKIQDNSDVEIVQSPVFVKNKNKARRNSGRLRDEESFNERKDTLKTYDDQANSDDVQIIQTSPNIHKISNSSRVIRDEAKSGGEDIFNLYSSKDSQGKNDSQNTKFTKKPSATVSWVSQEFPDPASQYKPLDNSLSSKLNNLSKAKECEAAMGPNKKSFLGQVFNSVSLAKTKRPFSDEKPSSIKRPRKGSFTLEHVNCDDEHNDSITETPFRFSSKAVQSTKISESAFVAPLKSKSAKPKKEEKIKASNIFDVSDDPEVMEILKREKAEAKNVAGNARKGSKFVKGVEKMMQFSQTLGHNKRTRFTNRNDKEFESPAKRQRNVDKKDGVFRPKAPATPFPKEVEPLQDSPDSLPMSPSLMISPVISRKLELLEEDEIEEDAENDSNEYVPDLDELLKLPERPADGSKTKDEILDEFDRQIAERQRLHEEEMAIVEADIEAENEKRRQRKLRLKENTKLRNLLETKLTEPLLRSMFQDNLEYLKDVWSGKVESSRHKAFHQSIRTRHALYYTIITDPFTDEQLDWTLDEISKVWMSNRRDQLDNKEYVWKVLLAECFIKFYMDFFNFSKNEAMIRISETPLHKKDRLKEFMSKSDEEESEEDDVVACDDRHKEEEVTMCADRHEEEVVIKCEEGNQRDEEAADSSNHTDETGGPSEGARINNVERHNNIVAYLKSGSVIEYEGELFQTRIPEISPFQNDLPFTKEHLQIEGLTNDSNSCAFISIIIALHRIRLVEHLFGEGCANMWTECLRYYLSALPNKDEFSLYPLLTAWNRLGHPKIAIGSFLDATEVVGQMFSHDRTNIKSNTLTRFFGSFSCPHCGLEEESLSCEGMTTNPFCPTLSLPQQTGEEAINVHELMRQFLQKPFPTRCTSCRGIVLDAKIKPKVGNFTIISLNRRMGNVSGTKNLANVVTYPVSDNVVDNICKETLATVNHSGIDPKDGGHFVAYSKIGNKWSRNDDNKRIVFPSHNPFQLNSSFGETVDIIFYKCQT